MRIIHTCQHPHGCPRRVKAYGWCKAHWQRICRTGEPGPATIAARSPLGRDCSVEACVKPVTNDSGKGMCGMHYQRWRKYGSPSAVKTYWVRNSLPGELNPNWSGDDAGYYAAHSRVRRQRGRAADLACVDCNEQARHWSYNNADPNERIEEGLRYSADPAYYDPRCVRCHSAFDRVGERP